MFDVTEPAIHSPNLLISIISLPNSLLTPLICPSLFSTLSLIPPITGSILWIFKTVFKVHKIEPVIGGVKVKFEDKNGEVRGVNSEFGSEVIDIKRFEDWMVEN